jgi:hypothetical protein
VEKHNVLWIEDGAFAEMSQMSAPIYVSGKYDLVIAIDATEGLQALMRRDKKFDTIIVDIRLPPGEDPEFLKLYYNRGESKVAARLGLSLLKRVIKDGEENNIPTHHSEVERFGIFTVEGRGELKDDLKDLGLEKISVYQKTEMNSKDKLREIIEDIRSKYSSARGEA